jgi:hypothetical protein
MHPAKVSTQYGTTALLTSCLVADDIMIGCVCLRHHFVTTTRRPEGIRYAACLKKLLFRGMKVADATAAASYSPLRCFSTHPQKNEPEEPEIVLYQRKTNPSVTLMQSGFAFSSLHTAYWIWYTTDFIPVVNAAQMQDLHVDPAIGWAGIAFAATLNFVFYLYPKRLVHKLSLRPDSQKIIVYTHRPPLMRPNIYPIASFPVGKHKAERSDSDSKKMTKYLKLNPSSPEALVIVKEYGGDVTRFRGNLKVGSRWPYYNLNIQSAKDVPEPELLMEALLRPEYFGSRDLLMQQDEITTAYGSGPHRWGRPKRPNKVGNKKIGKRSRRRR